MHHRPAVRCHDGLRERTLADDDRMEELDGDVPRIGEPPSLAGCEQSATTTERTGKIASRGHQGRGVFAHHVTVVLLAVR